MQYITIKMRSLSPSLPLSISPPSPSLLLMMYQIVQDPNPVRPCLSEKEENKSDQRFIKECRHTPSFLVPHVHHEQAAYRRGGEA